MTRFLNFISNFKLKISNYPVFIGLVLVVVFGLLFYKLASKPASAVPWPGNMSEWGKRKQVTLVNNSGQTLNTNTTYSVNIDTSNQKEFLQSCDDLRVVYQPSSTTATELARSVVNCNTTSAIVSFPLQANVSNGSSDDDYYVYYANSHATNSGLPTPNSAYDTTPGGASFVAPFNGSTAAAASGSGAPTTATGAIRYSGSKSALSFDGVNDRVAIADSASLHTTTFTIEAWFYARSWGSGAYMGLITKRTTYGTMDWELYYDASLSRIKLGIGENGGGFLFESANVNPSLNVWHHIAVTKSGASYQLFLDGVSQGTATSAVTWTDSDQVLVGTLGADVSSGYNFNGSVEEVRISDVVRYTSNFSVPTAPFIRDVNTKLLLHFDENGDDPRNTGKTIDDSGNANHGTITGAKYVGGLVGVDSSTTDSGLLTTNSYASHQGVFIEEGTTNKITNPSFENSTYDTNWTASASATVTVNTTAPYYKFGSTSAKIVVSGANSSYLTTITATAATHTLSAYVYNGTSGAIGGTVDATVAQLSFNGAARVTTYTDMGGGWWRLTYSGTAIASADTYGVEVKNTKTIYIDGIQLEALAYVTTYADGTLGTGYAWTGTANNSTSTRTVVSIKYPVLSNITTAAGTVSLWLKPNWAGNDSLNHTILDTDVSTRYFKLIKNSSNNLTFTDGTNTATTAVSWAAGQWQNIVVTWGSNNINIYVNSTAGTAAGAYSAPTLGTSLYVGQDSSSATQTNGTISDLRLFNLNLSSGQVSQLYYAGLGSHSEAAPVNRFASPEDPVAYWKFDEGTGAKVNNSAPPVQTPSTTNPSATFSGTLAGGVNLPTWQQESMCVSGKCLFFEGSSAKATLDSTPSAVQSISLWEKHASSSGTIPLLSLSGSVDVSVVNGTVTPTGFTSATVYVNGKASTTLSPNTWNHVEVVDTAAVTPVSVYLGNNNGGVTNFKGFLDEVKFYNYTRTAAQVKADYNGASKRGTTMNSELRTMNSLNNGLVGYWKMDEASGNAADSSGNSVTLTNNGTLSYAAGKFGNGANATVNTKYLSTTTAISGVKTVSFWINPTTTTTYPIDFNGTQTITVSGGTISANNFTGATIYVNGAASSTLAAGSWQQVIITTDTSFNTGTMTVGLVGANTMNGTLDELRIYNRALTPAEVRQLYNFAPGPVGYWKFDDPAPGGAGQVLDSSGNGNTGTWYGSGVAGHRLVTGKYGKAGGFNGGNDWVSVSNTISTNTVGFWVKPTTNTASMINLTSTQYITATSGTISATNFSSPTIYVNGVISSTLTANVWQYVTVTTATAISANTITIGKANSAYTTGSIDDVKIYNYARTADQIMEDMTGRSSPISLAGVSASGKGTLIDLKMDEGNSTTTKDSSGNQKNGTLNDGAAWSQSGKFGRGIQLDGTNDDVSVADFAY